MNYLQRVQKPHSNYNLLTNFSSVILLKKFVVFDELKQIFAFD